MQDPFGVRVTFEFGKITVEKEDLSHADLAEEGTVSAKDRVLKAVQDGPAYPEDIAEITELAVKTVKNKLTDLRKSGKIEATGEKRGQSQEVSLVSLSLRDGDRDATRIVFSTLPRTSYRIYTRLLKEPIGPSPRRCMKREEGGRCRARCLMCGSFGQPREGVD